jgi:hypothetical protein
VNRIEDSFFLRALWFSVAQGIKCFCRRRYWWWFGLINKYP